MAQKVAANNINDVILELQKKVELICKGSPFYYISLVKKMPSANLQNAKIIYEFLITEYDIQNVKLNTTLTHLKTLSLFTVFIKHKDFEKITKNDIIDYLNSSRKLESEDPTHKWIGTYNTRHMVLSKFFRWLYN